jgi:hypothetical protein
MKRRDFFGRKRPCPFEHTSYPDILLDETTKHFNEDKLLPDRDSNKLLSEYKSDTIPLY